MRLPMTSETSTAGIHQHRSCLRFAIIALLALLAVNAPANDGNGAGQGDGTALDDAVELPVTVVTAEAEYEGVVQPTFLPPVEGTKIYSGKKASVIDLDAFPKVQANNYRQALALTPGLLYSEETTPLVSMGYRGIGEPHRMQFFQVLKDGIPIHADLIGYPESYYTPPLDVVDRVEFIRGGAGLMYGPHHAGALNYVTYRPRLDRPFSLRSQHIFGTDSLYSTYNSVDGTVGRVGYLAYYNHRQSDGFRSANSDYVLDGGHFKVVLDADKPTRWTLAMDAYEEEHGEPGGLTLGTGPNDANYNEDREQATKLHDRFALRRYVPALTFDHDFSEETLLSVKAWGGYYDRFSKRQTGGGFGTFPNPLTATNNNIEHAEFYTAGTEARVRHNYNAWNGEHTFAGGIMYYHGDSPREDQRGAAPDADDGVTVSDSQRETHYGSIFFENRLSFDRLSITPGFRLENIAQSVETRTFSPTGVPLAEGEKDTLEVQPLFAISVAYQVAEGMEIYASVAESYRATIFTESVVAGSGAVIAGDVDPTKGLTYEIGYRGTVADWFIWDTSLFLVDIDDRFGGTTTNANSETILRSVGRSINYGWDAAFDLDLFGVCQALCGQGEGDRAHGFSLYGNVTLLEAEIHGGFSDGNEPQYSPNYIVRTGEEFTGGAIA